MSYESFRRTILPLSFDEEQISKEQTIADDDTFKFMYDYFNKGANKE